MTGLATRTTPYPDRPQARLRRPVTAGVAVALLGLLGACSSADDAAPSAPSTSLPTPTRSPAPTPSATASPRPTPTPTSTPTTAPEPPASPAPTAAAGGGGTGSGAASVVPLRSGGRIGDLPAQAPEADAVAYLTGVFGTGPTVEDPSSACGYDVGRRIRWGDLVVFVRSVDRFGAPVEPYVASWAVGEPSSSLTTVEGLRVGDPERRITELYPGAVSGEDEHSHGVTWWTAERDGATYSFITEGGTVSRLSSGAVCGE